MRDVVVAIVAGVVMVLPAASSAAADTRPCHTYRAAMQTARDALATGQRAAALAALQQAKTLLQRCRREEARHMRLLAAMPLTSRDG